MKMRLTLLLFVIFIYVSYAQSYAQNLDCSDNRMECYHQFLLKRWQDGADGQKQEAIDSMVLRRVLDALSSPHVRESSKKHREIVNLWLYRGLGIFASDYATFISDCIGISYHRLAIKMVRDYYNIDVDTATILKNRWGGWMWKNNHDMVIGVRGLPNDEAIVFLISGPTREVLSTYRYKEKTRGENGFADILE